MQEHGVFREEQPQIGSITRCAPDARDHAAYRSIRRRSVRCSSPRALGGRAHAMLLALTLCANE